MESRQVVKETKTPTINAQERALSQRRPVLLVTIKIRSDWYALASRERREPTRAKIGSARVWSVSKVGSLALYDALVAAGVPSLKVHEARALRDKLPLAPGERERYLVLDLVHDPVGVS